MLTHSWTEFNEIYRHSLFNFVSYFQPTTQVNLNISIPADSFSVFMYGIFWEVENMNREERGKWGRRSVLRRREETRFSPFAAAAIDWHRIRICETHVRELEEVLRAWESYSNDGRCG